MAAANFMFIIISLVFCSFLLWKMVLYRPDL
jgi:hypothetical protein